MVLVLLLLVLSGIFSGLTLGMMSLDVNGLEVIIAGGQPREVRQAQRILPLRRKGNRLLCTLRLGNVLVNSMLSIVLDALMDSAFGGGTGEGGSSLLSLLPSLFISTSAILMFGEILPQSACSRFPLATGFYTCKLVRVLMLLLAPVAYPVAKLLDLLLGKDLGTLYSRQELKELFAMQVSLSSSSTHFPNMPHPISPICHTPSFHHISGYTPEDTYPFRNSGACS